MSRLEGVSAKTALLGLVAVIIAGGFVVALFSNMSLWSPSLSQSGIFARAAPPGINFGNTMVGVVGPGNNYPNNSYVVSSMTIAQTTTEALSTTMSNVPQSSASTNITQGSPAGSGGLIEFSSDLSIRASSPSSTASGIIALAYSVGGYVAYQSTYPSSANVVIRVPASDYQQVLTKVEGMGTMLSLTSNSNDVRVQYTDLNATLLSLRTEQSQLLKLLNQSSTINSTLAIESQLQGVNQQINDIQSQILQTRTLVNYSTINVTITSAAQQVPLSMTLSATPTNGTSPLSVTFNAIVKGGAQPYYLNYNFGDGTGSQGQIVIHTYTQAGVYKVTVSATDQNGTVAIAPAVTIRVVAAPFQSGIASFLGTVSGLLVSVVEGIVEVAVVVLPIAAVGAAIIIPIQRRGRNPRSARQSG